MLRPLIAALALSLLACVPSSAHEVSAGDLTLSNLQVRASLGRNPNTAGYVVIRNAGDRSDTLVSASCACAERVEIHTVSTAGGVMRMSPVGSMAVPAGGALSLAPGGAHLMLIGVGEPLRTGATVRLTLTFARAGRVEADFHVVTTVADPAHAGH